MDDPYLNDLRGEFNSYSNQLKKLKKKNCDYLVLNYPISKNIIFNNKYNNGGIFNKKGHYHQIGNVTKTSFANQ
ncbi:MAG: hypothetical protein ACPG6Z_03165, partial [Nitrosopumilus sp.]